MPCRCRRTLSRYALACFIMRWLLLLILSLLHIFQRYFIYYHYYFRCHLPSRHTHAMPPFTLPLLLFVTISILRDIYYAPLRHVTVTLFTMPYATYAIITPFHYACLILRYALFVLYFSRWFATPRHYAISRFHDLRPLFRHYRCCFCLFIFTFFRLFRHCRFCFLFHFFHTPPPLRWLFCHTCLLLYVVVIYADVTIRFFHYYTRDRLVFHAIAHFSPPPIIV